MKLPSFHFTSSIGVYRSQIPPKISYQLNKYKKQFDKDVFNKYQLIYQQRLHFSQTSSGTCICVHSF
jgi:hypothetical protein